VTDIGISKVAETQGYTRVGTVIGTPKYMSPEHAWATMSGRRATSTPRHRRVRDAHRTPPFVGAEMALMRAHTEQTPDPLRSYDAEIPRRSIGS
jgi:hypothetical protein